MPPAGPSAGKGVPRARPPSATGRTLRRHHLGDPPPQRPGVMEERHGPFSCGPGSRRALRPGRRLRAPARPHSPSAASPCAARSRETPRAARPRPGRSRPESASRTPRRAAAGGACVAAAPSAPRAVPDRADGAACGQPAAAPCEAWLGPRGRSPPRGGTASGLRSACGGSLRPAGPPRARKSAALPGTPPACSGLDATPPPRPLGRASRARPGPDTPPAPAPPVLSRPRSLAVSDTARAERRPRAPHRGETPCSERRPSLGTSGRPVPVPRAEGGCERRA